MFGPCQVADDDLNALGKEACLSGITHQCFGLVAPAESLGDGRLADGSAGSNDQNNRLVRTHDLFLSERLEDLGHNAIQVAKSFEET